MDVEPPKSGWPSRRVISILARLPNAAEICEALESIKKTRPSRELSIICDAFDFLVGYAVMIQDEHERIYVEIDRLDAKVTPVVEDHRRREDSRQLRLDFDVDVIPFPNRPAYEDFG